LITPKKEPNSIGDVVFKIDISQTEKVEGGFFAGTQLFFVIRIVSTEIHAKRKIQDFIWFRECLCKEFPVSYIPPLALVENRPNDVEYIENQMINLTSFLQDIINSSELRNSEFLDAFLMTSDYNQFLESKKQLDQTLPKRDFRSTVTRAKGIETSLELLDLERMQTRSKHVLFFANSRSISKSLHCLSTSSRTTTPSARREESL
jgi:hypothetical protein